MDNALSITVISISLLFFLLMLFYVIIKIYGAYKRRMFLHSKIDILSIKEVNKLYLIDTTNRAKTFYISFILYSFLIVFCRFFSAVFTVCGFYVTNCLDVNVLQQVFSILSVFFVLPSLFLIPQERSKQYLLAWRKLDNHILGLLLVDYDKLTSQEQQNIFEKSNGYRKELEDSLKKDEDI